MSGSTSDRLSIYLPLFLLPSLASAFSFNFGSIPSQCQSLNISISGSGQPPYTVLIVPFGPSTLPNATEVRKIFQQNFTGDATSQTFQLSYPVNSQFVAVVRPFVLAVDVCLGVEPFGLATEGGNLSNSDECLRTGPL